MKTKTLTFALLASLAALAGTTARADSNDNRFNNEPNRAEHRNDFRDDRRDDRNDRDFRGPGRDNDGPRRVVVVPGPRNAPPAAGFWRDTVVKTWVPAYWTTSRDYRGRPVRTFVAGHYDSHIERTWVPTGYRR